MKRKFRVIALLFILMFTVLLLRPTWTKSIEGENSISTFEKVEINGAQHTLLIRGENINNPVLLYVHGGPGVSEMSYAINYQKQLESKFTIVHYDQRATGKSFKFTENYSNLTPALLVDDLLHLTDYIANRFNKEKIILVGHSYGTYTGMQAASRAPEKYEAYIGIGQVADTIESEKDILAYVIEQARQAGNEKDVLSLIALTEKIENGKMFTPRAYVIKYGGATRLIDNPDGDILGMLVSREYNILDIIRHYSGLVITQNRLLQDLSKDLLPSMIKQLDVPFYFVMGKYDYMTSWDAAYHYFQSIQAEEKHFVTFEHSAHYPQFEEEDKFYEWMISTFIENNK